MRSRSWSFSVSVVGLLVALVVGAAQAATREPGAVLVTPKQNAKVERGVELVGKVLMRGWPIVLVRADQPGSLWWVQEPVQGTGHGYFKANARFGNDKTSPGTPFRVIVLMIQTAEDAKQFKPGDSFPVLPPNLPCSAETVVVLEKKDESNSKGSSNSLAGLIVSPEAMSRVSQQHPVEGRVSEDLQPVVLVRSAEPNSPWWVQGKPVVDDEGSFQAMARFGSDKTPDGSEFRIVVLVTRRGRDGEFRAGTVVKELPPGVERSAEVRVVLARQSQAAVSQSAGSTGAAGGQ